MHIRKGDCGLQHNEGTVAFLFTFFLASNSHCFLALGWDYPLGWGKLIHSPSSIPRGAGWLGFVVTHFSESRTWT